MCSKDQTKACLGVSQGLLLSAYLKMLLADPSDDQLRQQISAVYERYSHFMDADLQQRAVEYIGLMKHPDVASRNVTAMPKWEKRKSLLLRRMAEKEVSGSFSGFYIHLVLCSLTSNCPCSNICMLGHRPAAWASIKNAAAPNCLLHCPA